METTPPITIPHPLTFNALLKSPIKVIKTIPRPLQAAIHDLYCMSIRRILQAPNEQLSERAILEFLAIPKCVLREKGTRDQSGRRNLSSSTLSERVQTALNRNYDELFTEAVSIFGHDPTPPRLVSADPLRAALRRCRRLMKQGNPGRAASALLQKTLPLPPTAQRAEQLQQLHPKPPSPISQKHPHQLPEAYKFSVGSLRSAAQSLPTGTAPGPDGLTPYLLKKLLRPAGGVDPQNDLANILTKFVNSACTGKLPKAAQPHFCGGRLTAMPKPGDKVQPIAVGLLIRRVIARMLAHAAAKEAAGYLAPHQLGVSIKGGAEAIIHAVKLATHNPNLKEAVLLQIDAKNAFNSVSRQDFLDRVTEHVPGIARWVHYCYGATSHLLFGDYLIESATGSQQGDPLGALLFCLALQPLIEKFEEQFRPYLNTWYMDDGNIVIHCSKVEETLTFFQQEGNQYGFHINLQKTQAYGLSNSVPAQQVSCPFSTPEGFVVLGTPIGSDEFVNRFLDEKQKEIDNLFEDLLSLEDPQTAFHLHRYCASVSKVLHLLRTIPINQTTAFAASFDMKQRRSFERLNRTCTDKGWNQATLRFGDGGLGLTPTSTIIEAAHLASVVDTTHLTTQITQVHQQYAQERVYAAISLWQAQCPNPPSTLSTISLLHRAKAPIPQERLQHVLVREIQRRRAKHFLQRASEEERARLLSAASPSAASFFATLPSPYRGTAVSPNAWRFAIALRLGLPIFSGSTRCPPCFNISRTEAPVIDKYGKHALTCTKKHGITRRHHILRDLLHRHVLRPLGITGICEHYLPDIVLEDGTLHRVKCDIFIPAGYSFTERSWALDVTVAHPLAGRHLQSAAATGGAAATANEKEKVPHYRPTCDANDIELKAIGVDAFGALGDSAKIFFHQMATYSAERRSTRVQDEIQHLVQRFIARLHTAQARMITSRLQTGRVE